ncbi:MAG: radical SAM family heme chaperone HemW [Phycisphaerae bacterium]|nr:radical SAM family heme chaperone HemW [Phycisphaerae bacterium]
MVRMIVNSCKENQAFVPRVDAETPNPPGALYVHVPFCRAKCRYCDFYSRPADDETMDAYVESVLAERRLRESEAPGPFASIFFGGGTPTLLGAERLARLLRELTPPAKGDAEISIEANPGTIDAALARAMIDGGVNRVSLGAQSFRDEELAFLGRIHRAGEIYKAVDALRAAGSRNLGLDLIYAIPGQSEESWRESLEAAIGLQPQHVSCYALSFEAGTPLGDDLQAGRVEETDDETQRRMFDQAIERLTSAGYEHYEISNFAQPGFRCRHNLVYWRNQSYLGLGPGACSYIRGIRRANRPDTSRYLQCLQATPPEAPPSEQERLTGYKAMAETLMLNLRLIEGVEIESFRRRFGLSPLEAFEKSFQRYGSQGAVVVTDSHVRLSRDSLFTSNSILADLLAEWD